MAAATQQQQFCVRWNSYQSNLQNAFPKLLTSEHFVDVTLACESEMIKCHKVVLSACSTYFEKLLVQNPCQHPIIFMKDMRFAEMQALVDFMYKGEVNVTQDELPSLLRSAEALQIRGLCGSDQLLSQHYLGNLQKPAASTRANTESTTGPAVNGERKEAPAAPGAATTSTSANGVKEEASAPAENGRLEVKREAADSDGGANGSPEHDFSDVLSSTIKEDVYDTEDSFYDNDADLMDTDYLDQDDDEQAGPSSGGVGSVSMLAASATSSDKSPDFAIANVSCQYNDGSPGGGIPGARRIRRSEAELRRAAECITRGQTFQTVSDQFNIPISTIRFYMARKGILPRRKRGRACSTPGGGSHMLSQSLPSGGFHGSMGNTSPIGPPYHIVHYKLPVLGAKLK